MKLGPKGLAAGNAWMLGIVVGCVVWMIAAEGSPLSTGVVVGLVVGVKYYHHLLDTK